MDNDKIIISAQQNGIQKFVVGAVIFNKNNVLLLTRSSNEFMAGLVELPSGGVEDKETLYEALTREVREETGLTVNINSFIGFFDYVSGSGRKTRQFNFVCDTQETTVTINPKEHSSFQWIDCSQIIIDSLNLSNETIQIIRKAYGDRLTLPK